MLDTVWMISKPVIHYLCSVQNRSGKMASATSAILGFSANYSMPVCSYIKGIINFVKLYVLKLNFIVYRNKMNFNTNSQSTNPTVPHEMFTSVVCCAMTHFFSQVEICSKYCVPF